MKAKVAREMGRIAAAASLEKNAADDQIGEFLINVGRFAKSAGLKDGDVHDMLEKVAINWGAALGGAATGAGLGGIFGVPGMAVGGLLGGGAGLLADWWRGGQKPQQDAAGGAGGAGGNNPLYPKSVMQMAAQGGWNPKQWGEQMDFARNLGMGVQSRRAVGNEFRNIFNAGTGMWG